MEINTYIAIIGAFFFFLMVVGVFIFGVLEPKEESAA